jgi:ABC-type phosphate transport system ATPase subunit
MKYAGGKYTILRKMTTVGDRKQRCRKMGKVIFCRNNFSATTINSMRRKSKMTELRNILHSHRSLASFIHDVSSNMRDT